MEGIKEVIKSLWYKLNCALLYYTSIAITCLSYFLSLLNVESHNFQMDP